MTVREIATYRLGLSRPFRIKFITVLIVVVKPRMNVSHQDVNIAAAMVSSYIGVKVLPQAFDSVFVRTMRRQKVRYDLAIESLYRSLGNLTTVNTIVVKNHMNYSVTAIVGRQFCQQLDEQSAGLSFALHPDQTAGADIHRSGEVAFNVLPRRDRFFLLTANHPV